MSLESIRSRALEIIEVRKIGSFITLRARGDLRDSTHAYTVYILSLTYERNISHASSTKNNNTHFDREYNCNQMRRSDQ